MTTVKQYIEKLAEGYPSEYGQFLRKDLFENWADELDDECNVHVEMAIGGYLPMVALEWMFRFFMGIGVNDTFEGPISEPKGPAKVLPFKDLVKDPDKEEKRQYATTKGT